MRKVTVLRYTRWLVVEHSPTMFWTQELGGRRKGAFPLDMCTDADQAKVADGACFVEKETYEDTPGGNRTHCWRIRFPWAPKV